MGDNGLRIRNWSKFQHYQDRCPPWVKLHFELLSSADWVALSDVNRVLAVACMLVASKNEGKIDGSDAGLQYLRRVAYLNSPPDLNPLVECGFLVRIADASALQADACSESEKTEKKTDKKGSPLSQNQTVDNSSQTPTQMIRNMATERGVSWDVVLAHAGGEPPWSEPTITALRQYLQPLTKYTDAELDARLCTGRGNSEPKLIDGTDLIALLRAGQGAGVAKP